MRISITPVFSYDFHPLFCDFHLFSVHVQHTAITFVFMLLIIALSNIFYSLVLQRLAYFDHPTSPPDILSPADCSHHTEPWMSDQSAKALHSFPSLPPGEWGIRDKTG